MLVEINLLPKKEHRQSSKYIIALLVLIIFSASFMGIYLQGHVYEGKMEQTDKQIEAVQKLNTAQHEKMANVEAGNSAVKLQAAVQWAEKYSMDTVPLLRKMIGLLPERGFIRNLEYSGPHTLTVHIQFDAARDAAFYLSSLKQSEWVEGVDLEKVTAEKEKGEETASPGPGPSAEEILPRYLAEFSIVFKSDYFQQNGNAAAEEDET